MRKTRVVSSPDRFAYDRLPEGEAAKMREHEERALGLLRQMKRDTLELANVLFAAKADLAHGSFLGWCRDVLRIEARTVENIMNFGKLAKSHPSLALKIGNTLGYYLGARSRSTQTIAFVRTEVEKGRRPTLREVQQFQLAEASKTKSVKKTGAGDKTSNVVTKTALVFRSLNGEQRDVLLDFIYSANPQSIAMLRKLLRSFDSADLKAKPKPATPKVFDGEQAAGEIDNRIEKAITCDDEPETAVPPVQQDAPQQADFDVDAAARAGDADGVTRAFLRELLEEN